MTPFAGHRVAGDKMPGNGQGSPENHGRRKSSPPAPVAHSGNAFEESAGTEERSGQRGQPPWQTQFRPVARCLPIDVLAAGVDVGEARITANSSLEPPARPEISRGPGDDGRAAGEL